MHIAKWGLNFLLLTGLVCKFASSSADSSEIDKLFANIDVKSPGAAVLVIQNGHPIFENGFGVADLRSSHKIDEHTNFRLASLTKQFTATAIMLLVHDGKLRYDETLTEVFPEFPVYGKVITVRNLLNHTNYGPIIGNITSPLFGTSNQVAGSANGEGFSELANNRRLELQFRFTF